MKCEHATILAPLVLTSYLAGQPAAPDTGTELARELLSDAGARASFQSSGATAGHDGRFFLASSDGNFKLQASGEVQFRYYSTFGAQDDGGNDIASGFQLNRTRLDLRGHVLDPKLTFRILTNFNRDGGTLELQDAYGEYELENGLKIRWGQFKLPFDREFFATSATQTQTIEPSIVSSVFRLDRSQGIQLSYEAERWRAFGAFSDGRRALNTAYYNEAEADIALTGRAEVRFGEAGWRQFRDQSAFRGDKSGALVGVGGHWQQDGATGAPSSAGDNTDLFAWTADAGYEADGWSVLGGVTGRAIDWDDGSYTDWGVFAQGGVFLSDHAELFARYARIMPDDGRSGGSEDFSAITAGVNYYFVPGSHAAKLSAELTCYPDAQADSASLVRAPDTGVGIGPDSEDGQWGLGIQMQMVF
jgi:hypothetical protein